MSAILKAPATARLVIPEFTGDYFWLSNFYPRPLKFDAGEMFERPGITFPMSEHAYQACKYLAMDNVEYPVERLNYVMEVAQEPDPTKSKRLGKKVNIDLAKWEDIKDGVMRRVVFEKFAQHADLREKLLQTHTAMLVEGNTWGDTYWGRAGGKGYNHLGVILMEVRGYYQHHYHGATTRQALPPIDNIIAG